MAIVLALIALVGLIPGYRALRSWRASSLAKQAVEHIEDGAVHRAHELAAASLQLESYSTENRRLFARSFEESASDAALGHGHALSQHPEASPEDLRYYVSQCLDRDFAAGSVQALKRLLDTEPANVANWVLLGEYELARGRIQEALTAADRALTLEPKSLAAKLLGSMIASASEDPDLQASGRKHLWEIAAQDDVIGLRALSHLAAGRTEDPSEASRVRDRLRDHPLARTEHYLAGERLLLHTAIGKTSKETIIQKNLDRYGKIHRPLIFAWLNRVGETARILSILPLEEAATDRDLFLIRCEAMLAQGQEAELLNLLDPPSQAWPIRNSTRQFLAIESARKLGQDDRADRLWTSLITEAERVNPPVTLISLAQRFENKELYEDAAQSYHYLTQKFPGQRGYAYDRLTHVYRATGDTEALQSASEEMMRLVPDNPIYQHNWAYLAFLRGESLNDAEAVLESLVKAYRLAPSICALAWLAYENGNDEKALELIAPLAWKELSALDQRMVHRITPTTFPPKELKLTLLPEERKRLAPSAGTAMAPDSEAP